MSNNLFSALIPLDDRITPTEIRVQVIKPDRHLYRDHCREKPQRIYEHRRQTPHRRSIQSKPTNSIAQNPGKAFCLPVSPPRHTQLLSRTALVPFPERPLEPTDLSRLEARLPEKFRSSRKIHRLSLYFFVSLVMARPMPCHRC